MSEANTKKDVWEMVRLGLTLVCYAVASCTVLALVNNFTSKKIQLNQLDKANAAMKEVFAQADEFKPVSDFEPSSNNSITLSDAYLAYADEKIVGAVIQVAGPTYDKGKLIVGVDSNGIVTGMRFLELTDSPGFGSKAKDDSYKLKNGKTFYGQFEGKDAKLGFIRNETFDAISGATITSDSVANLLSEGTSCLIKYLAMNGGQNE